MRPSNWHKNTIHFALKHHLKRRCIQNQWHLKNIQLITLNCLNTWIIIKRNSKRIVKTNIRLNENCAFWLPVNQIWACYFIKLLSLYASDGQWMDCDVWACDWKHWLSYDRILYVYGPVLWVIVCRHCDEGGRIFHGIKELYVFILFTGFSLRCPLCPFWRSTQRKNSCNDRHNSCITFA